MGVDGTSLRSVIGDVWHAVVVGAGASASVSERTIDGLRGGAQQDFIDIHHVWIYRRNPVVSVAALDWPPRAASLVVGVAIRDWRAAPDRQVVREGQYVIVVQIVLDDAHGDLLDVGHA